MRRVKKFKKLWFRMLFEEAMASAHGCRLLVTDAAEGPHVADIY